jgi:cell wall-associated NlpC family hydrolase
MILAFAFCNVSLLPVRKDPLHTAEQINQLLYGERCEVLEINHKEWVRIKGEWDGYDGWCKASQLTFVERKEYRKPAKYITTGSNDRFILPDANMWLPLGSDLMRCKGNKTQVDGKTGAFKGTKTVIAKLEINADNLKNAAMQYLHAPYVWGGRSVAGIDCSGLSQMAYKLCGFMIPRDALQQANEGKLVDFLQHAQCGDLAFFDNADGKIVHVGLLLDEQTIIHATDTSGHVVIDRIDHGGIISTTLKRRTHNLRLVRRYF